MSRKLIPIFQCDSCQSQMRGEETTGWFVIPRLVEGSFALTRWDWKLAEQEGSRHACGATCALTLASAYVSEIPVPAGKAWP